MPQWDFLDFLTAQGKKFKTFELLMEHEATDLVRANGRVHGVSVHTPDGTREIRADLVVACDGRHSAMRQAANLPLREFGVPIDVLWFRISRRPGDPEQLLGNVNYGHVLILINRGEYFQAGFLIRKGAFDELKAAGLDAFRNRITRIAPYLSEHVQELQNWDQIKLLTVQLNRLQRWCRPGLLCIGDAAHAMSPAGGVGINLAIQDAVATANLLSDALLEKRVNEELLAQVQRRREFPTVVTQTLQANAHKLLNLVFETPGPIRAPWQLKAVVRIPGFTHLTARAIGMGVRPEHIRDARPSRCKAKRMAKIAVALGVAAGFLTVWSMRRQRA
jgi:2-polyprenyl-6-methoxyphenol hydroxylase-like FAD-dependent oxidoreductase